MTETGNTDKNKESREVIYRKEEPHHDHKR